MILLAAHLDRVRNNFNLSYKNGRLTGLLDNILGVATVYHSLLDDPNIARLEAEGKMMVWHNKSEEWGELDPSVPILDKKEDMVIVVDVCSSKKYKGLDFTIENVSGFDAHRIKDLQMHLKWEGFAAKVTPFKKDVDFDDGVLFRERGIPTVSFIIPISTVDNSWHRIQDDSHIDLERWRVACEGLKRVINYFYLLQYVE